METISSASRKMQIDHPTDLFTQKASLRYLNASFYD